MTDFADDPLEIEEWATEAVRHLGGAAETRMTPEPHGADNFRD